MKELLVIKIGGNIIDDEKALEKFLFDFSEIDAPKILIHGGGKLATELSGKLNIKTQMVEGRRITDSSTLEIVTMVYGGWINKTITAKLNAGGNKAIGLCGSDLFLVPSSKRTKEKIDYGFVGDIIQNNIDVKSIIQFIEQNIILVLAPITADEKGQLLNTNADSLASSVAIALSNEYSVKLIYCFDKKGVLHNDEVIESINSETYKDLKQKQIIKDGMIPKLDNSFNSLESGVKEIIIGHAGQIHQIIKQHAGTKIFK